MSLSSATVYFFQNPDSKQPASTEDYLRHYSLLICVPSSSSRRHLCRRQRAVTSWGCCWWRCCQYCFVERGRRFRRSCAAVRTPPRCMADRARLATTGTLRCTDSGSRCVTATKHQRFYTFNYMYASCGAFNRMKDRGDIRDLRDTRYKRTHTLGCSFQFQL